jgi:preprotein translocase subunit SecG
MEQIILIVHVLAAIGIIALILMQQGKGADAGASFGAGASQTLFGSSGSGNFLTKSTTLLAVVFFATSFALAIVAKDKAAVSADAGLPSAEVIEQQNQAAGDAVADEIPVAAPVVEGDDIPE